MFGRLFTACCLTFVALTFCGCSGNGYGGTDKRSDSKGTKKILRVVATTEMVADLARHVVGSHGKVTSLIGSGGDPHLYRAMTNDTKKLYEADVVFYSGLTLEGRMQDALKQLNSPTKPVIAVTSKLEKDDKEYLRSPPGFEGHYDPHVWMDVTAWSRCLDVVVETLARTDPTHASEFEDNAKEYRKELAELDEYIQRVTESIPLPQRVLVTAHDAFGYFGRKYGIDVRSIQGVTTESEAGIQDINRLVDFLTERRLPAIFVESSVSEKNIRAVIEGTSSRGFTVHVGGQLFSDAMGAEGTYEGTYIGMLDHNATTIARALGGSPPEKGFRNQLQQKADAP